VGHKAYLFIAVIFFKGNSNINVFVVFSAMQSYGGVKVYLHEFLTSAQEEASGWLQTLVPLGERAL